MIKEFRTLHHDLGKIVGADVDGVGAARALKSAPSALTRARKDIHTLVPHKRNADIIFPPVRILFFYASIFSSFKQADCYHQSVSPISISSFHDELVRHFARQSEWPISSEIDRKRRQLRFTDFSVVVFHTQC